MIRVLVVEDHEVIRDALAALLAASTGMQVVGTASSIRDATPLLDRHDPDVVLADLSLADGSGMELVRVVRRAGLNSRVVILTGFGDAFAAAEALSYGVAGYAVKSQSAAEIVEAIRAVGAGGHYVAPQMTAKMPGRPSDVDVPSKASSRGKSLAALSRREHEVFLQVVEGYSVNEIARRLHISRKTVETHRSRIHHKLSLRTDADLIRFAVAYGIAVAPRVLSDDEALDGARNPPAFY
jgi:two-component system, NarL family, invasion response regulator UvrY